MGRCCTGYTAISGGMSDMAHSYGARSWLAAAWRLHSSHGYGLFGAKMPSEKMRLMRGLRGAECELAGLPMADDIGPLAVRTMQDLHNHAITQVAWGLLCVSYTRRE